MRHTIETAPRDGKVVILEHDPTGINEIAHWSAQAGKWVSEDGEPSKITPTHWRPMPKEKHLPHDDAEPSNSSQFGRSPRTRRLVVACAIALAHRVRTDAPLSRFRATDPVAERGDAQDRIIGASAGRGRSGRHAGADTGGCADQAGGGGGRAATATIFGERVVSRGSYE
jgi:hypothetical protein